MHCKLTGEALLEPHGGHHAGLDTGAELRIVGVPGARLDELIARHVGGRARHRPAS